MESPDSAEPLEEHGIDPADADTADAASPVDENSSETATNAFVPAQAFHEAPEPLAASLEERTKGKDSQNFTSESFMESILRKKSEQLEELTKKLLDTTAELETQKINHDNLVQSLREAHDELSVLRACQDDLAAIASAKDSHQVEISQLKAEVADLSGQLSGLLRELDSNKGEKASLETRLVDLEKEKKAAFLVRQNLEMKLQTQLDECNQEKISLLRRNQDLSAEIDSVRQKLLANAEAESNSLRQKINSMSEALASLASGSIKSQDLDQAVQSAVAAALPQSKSSPMLFYVLGAIAVALVGIFIIGNPTTSHVGPYSSFLEKFDQQSALLAQIHHALLDPSSASSTQDSPPTIPISKSKAYMGTIKLVFEKQVEPGFADWLRAKLDPDVQIVSLSMSDIDVDSFEMADTDVIIQVHRVVSPKIDGFWNTSLWKALSKRAPASRVRFVSLRNVGELYDGASVFPPEIGSNQRLEFRGRSNSYHDNAHNNNALSELRKSIGLPAAA